VAAGQGPRRTRPLRGRDAGAGDAQAVGRTRIEPQAVARIRFWHPRFRIMSVTPPEAAPLPSNRFVPIVAAILGCTASPDSSDARVDEGNYQAAIVARSSTELIAALPSEWVDLCESPQSTFAVSPDVEVVGTLEITNDQIPTPVKCANVPFDQCGPWFFIETGLIGIEAVDTLNLGAAGTVISRIRITSGRYRFRPMTFLVSPDLPLLHVMAVVAATDAECPETSLTCSRNSLCYSAWVSEDGQDFSFLCHDCYGLSFEKCACWTPSDDKPDGTPCQATPACPDNQLGTCQTGKCVPTKR